ncbi:putative lipopolysaccharide-modifying enzyme [Lyophyllum shimeji]|uniref:Lipopolysaccharide-modifying enzyme n=1 Tax=Lyophyllum shimeji TaxID=47721 RepID=A0A9P3PPT6_LYOSH|nr:putative lipopolysaccharide-modifying enzyme [Lyophyllum shimeji]
MDKGRLHGRTATPASLTSSFLAKGLRRRFTLLLLIVIVGIYFGRLLQLTPNSSRSNVRDHREARCDTLGSADDEQPISAHHTYLPNGLLHVNPDGIHPILELVKKAEEEWEKKLDRASRTLEEAVVEYKRRYKRDPPEGFDDWWDFAHEMEVQLPDEYDTIYRELEPFWGMDPKDLAELLAIEETKPDSFTLAKNETHDTHLVTTAFSDPETWEERGLLRGMKEIRDLLDTVEPALPPFRAVFSPHGTANLLSDYNVRRACLDAAGENRYVELSKLPKPARLGFASACPPGSPGRPDEPPVNHSHRPPPRTDRTFIFDHRLSMDPCRHPHIFRNHAQYLAHDVGTTPQPTAAPRFTYSTTALFHDIQLPSFLGWTPETSPRVDDPLWESKTDERLHWRGSNIGMAYTDSTQWRDSHRSRLVSWAHDINGTVNVLIPGYVEDEGWKRVGHGTVVSKALLNPAMLDIAFSGTPRGCDLQYCRYLETQFEWRKNQDANGKEAGNHKYILDVDGKGWSKDFKRLMSSNSVIFKSTAYPEWWLDRSQPWVHYVPIKVDYSDLYDAYFFFRGGLYGEGNHDHLAKKIAYAGREWSKTFWREEDMTVYLFRLLLEYARVMHPDRESKSYKPTG